MAVRNKLELGPPTPELVARAELELRETPEVRHKAIQQLRELIRAEDTLDCSTNDEFLIRFLRPTKFYPESALEKILEYYAHIRKHAVTYGNMGPLHQSLVLQSSLISVSPVRDQLGRRLSIIRFGAWDPKTCPIDDLYNMAVACAELGAREPATQIAGGISILDMRDTSLRHVAQLSPSYAKKIIEWAQKSFPMRFKAFHIINQPRIFGVIFSIFKPFLDNKLRERIHFHGSDLNSLHKHVSPSCLTKEYGGELDNYDQDGITDLLIEHEHIFKEIRSYAYDHQNS